MEDQKTKKPVDLNYLLTFNNSGPLIAAQLANAFYTAMLIKQNEGVKITKEVEHQISDDLCARWIDYLKYVLALHDGFLSSLKKPDEQ